MCLIESPETDPSAPLSINTADEDVQSTTTPLPPAPVQLPVISVTPEPETDEERRRQAEQWVKVRRLFVPPMATMVFFFFFFSQLTNHIGWMGTLEEHPRESILYFTGTQVQCFPKLIKF